MLGALSIVARRSPEIVGKPYTAQVDLFMEDKGIKDKSKIIIIGDRFDTGIKLGKNAGIDTVLVLTGVGKIEGMGKEGNGIPTHILKLLEL